jgi:hypothetical protein
VDREIRYQPPAIICPMNLQAICFMCNDFARLDFTLSGFCSHNPDIPVTVINSGGDSPSEVTSRFSSVALRNERNLWHRETHCGTGSFGPRYYDILFDYGINGRYTHTLFLETDVRTIRPVQIEPETDIAGVFGCCGGNEHVLYDYLAIEGERYHSGCGATLFSLDYFKKTSRNFRLFHDLFETHRRNYFMDLITTLVGRKSGCSWGCWAEVSNRWGHYVKYDNGWKFVPCNEDATMVHGWKV